MRISWTIDFVNLLCFSAVSSFFAGDAVGLYSKAPPYSTKRVVNVGFEADAVISASVEFDSSQAAARRQELTDCQGTRHHLWLSS